MPKKATVKYRSLRSNLVHLPLSLYAVLAQQQARPQGIILHLLPLITSSFSSSKRPQAAYLGWSGLAAASSLAGGLAGLGRGEGLETVEVDPEVAMGLGWAESTIVEISVIHNPTKARSVSVTPLTSDDWEILKQHASFLENNLLSQLRAAQKGQVLDVWVMGRTKIRIRVDDTDPKTSDTSAVLVHSETEIFVAPRPRDFEPSSRPLEPNKTVHSPSSPIKSTQNGRKKREKHVELRLVPPRVAARWGDSVIPQDQLDKVGNDRIVVCSPDTLERVKRRLRSKGDGMLYIRLDLVGRENKGQDKREGEQASNGEPDAEREDEGLEGFLVPWEEMPEGCVALPGKVEEKWQGWSSVQITAASPRKGRLKSGIPKVSAPVFQVPSLQSSRHLAGVDLLVMYAVAYLRRSNAVEHPRPLLLLGAKGSGKTSIAKLVAEHIESDREVMADVFYQDVGRMDSDSRLSATKEKMTDLAEEAKRRQPCLLILDGLDSLIRPEHELTPSSNPAALADHFCRLFSHSSLPLGVLVIVIATSSASLHPLLNAKHVFGETIKINVPNKEIRREMLLSLVGEQRRSSSNLQANGDLPELDFVTVANTTEGYTASDLSDLVEGALQQTMIRTSQVDDHRLDMSMEDFALAQAAMTPLSLRGVTLQKSEVKWSDIGGLSEPRRVLRETLEWPTKYSQIFASCPLRLRSGLLLYGFPGCGKTLLASAVAKECGLNFVSVKGPEILNKYIGASEKAVRDLFERAGAAKPCVLFFDEFDSIAPKRGHDSTGVTDRVVNQMLTEMDGAQGLEGVYVLAATSRPDLIDPALLRPGRLDKSLLCNMPSQSDRLEILEAVSRKLTFHPSVDLADIAVETEGYSGADLQAVVYNAHLEVIHASIAPVVEMKGKGKDKGKAGAVSKGPEKIKRNYRQVAPAEDTDVAKSLADRAAMTSRIDSIVENASGVSASATLETRKEVPKPVIEQVHLLRSLANTRPSVSPSDRARLQYIYRSFISDRDGSMANGDLGRDTGTRVSLM